ncbi:hypothetical protein [Microbacterium sp. cf046]|uniref:hypothetical protein n=1 Tax=Microbacterium sp. cf046 TaxID=1761803 RepID=UPI0011143410|nr:hypothetical protein [Microbacterium sp. cf046]
MSFGAPENDGRISNGVSRRTLVKGAAWAVPVIAFAGPVPAMAASPCTPTTALDTLKPGTKPTSIAFFPSDPLVTAGLAFTSSSGSVNRGNTGEVAATNTNPSWNYIEIEMEQNGQRPLTQGDWVQLTITLNQPVTGLSFVIHDIDQTQSGWRDLVNIRTAGYTANLGNPTNIQGDGSDGNPFRPIANGDLPIDSGANAIRLTWAGSVQVVVIRYIAGITGNSGNQHIGLGNLSYSACVFPTAKSSSARSSAVVAPELIVPPTDLVLVDSDGSADL